jgi:tetratricopeptide (TPR) repeat protein
MHLLALLFAAVQGLPAIPPRVPVPPRANLTSLDTDAKACAAAYPEDDRCYDLLMAAARALAAAGRNREAMDAANKARMGVLHISDPVDDAYDNARGRAEFQKRTPEQIDPDFPRIVMLRKRLWREMAEAHLLHARAAEETGALTEAASGFGAYWSIHDRYVQDPQTAERALATGLRGAELYLMGGAAEQAESMLSFSFARYEQAFGKDHPTIVGMVIVRARANSAMGKYADAERDFAEARARAMRTGRPILQADADAAWARHLLAIDHPREALDLQRSVVTRLASAQAPPARMAQAYRDFAEVSTGQEALNLIARAVDLHVAAYGPDHLLTGRVRIVAADLLDRQGDRDRAERERAAGIEILEKRLPVLSPEIALAKLRQAENLMMKDRCEEVHRLAGYALDSFIYIAAGGARLGNQHPNTARALFLMGMCEMRTKPASAIDRLKRAAAIQRAVLTPTHTERMHTEMALGFVARMQGDFGGALRQLRSVSSAARERIASYTAFDADAQREQREFAPVYHAIIQTAWVASQPR